MLAGNGILESNVWLAITSEISDACDVPLRTNRRENDSRSIGPVIKDPEYVLTSSRVL
jgi:hypothetical protein